MLIFIDLAEESLSMKSFVSIFVNIIAGTLTGDGCALDHPGQIYISGHILNIN